MGGLPANELKAVHEFIARSIDGSAPREGRPAADVRRRRTPTDPRDARRENRRANHVDCPHQRRGPANRAQLNSSAMPGSPLSMARR
jgi:hypothetical protein